MKVGTGRTARSTSSTAAGEASSYQWYQGSSDDPEDSTAIDGVTNMATTSDGLTEIVFTTPALTSDAEYWVRVSNPAGYVDSLTAVITVATSDNGSSSDASPTPGADTPTPDSTETLSS